MRRNFTLYSRLLLFVLLWSSLGANYLQAQMRVGLPSASPDKSASLEINSGPYSSGSEYRGLLPPKVALTKSLVSAPISQPATGLLIYNTATTGDVTPGYYYWEGSRWLRFETATKGAARVGTAGGGQSIKAYLLNEIQNQSITDDNFILVEPGREGLFRYDAIDTTTPDNGGTVLVAASNKRYKRAFSGSVDVRWFGAKGDATTDDRIAIQKALDSKHPDITFPAGYTFIVSLNPALSTPEGTTGIAINVSSNTTLRLLGTIKLKSGSVGNGSVIIGNTVPIVNVHILGDEMGVIDGNRSQVTKFTINVCLYKAMDSSIEGISALNSSYFGISFRGITPGYGRNAIRQCKVNNIAYIGIQAEKPELGVRIEGNTVTNCGDNGIDVEGNDSLRILGKDIYILNNVIKHCALGIFLESLGDALVSQNIIDSVSSNCVYMNRIHSGSFSNRIVHNKFKNCPTGYGVNFNSYVGESDVSNNYFENLRSSIVFNGGATRVTVGPNNHKNIKRYIVQIEKVANSAVKSYVEKQFLLDAPNATTGYPFVVSPITNPINSSNRSYLTAVMDGYSLELGAALPTTFFRRTTSAANNQNWNAYALYYNNTQTILYVPVNPPSVNDYININGTPYYVSGMAAAGEYIIQDINKANGNYAAAINGNYPLNIYYSAWTVD